jgi:hypothetical protein
MAAIVDESNLATSATISSIPVCLSLGIHL